jgi:hypothetical protein
MNLLAKIEKLHYPQTQMTNDWQVLANRSSRSATPSLMHNKKRLATFYVLRSVNEKEGISVKLRPDRWRRRQDDHSNRSGLLP